VDRLHELLGFLLVALDALFRDFRPRFESYLAAQLDQVAWLASAAEANPIPAMRTAAAMKRGILIKILPSRIDCR
jgi:hypothetical protein